MGVLLSLNLTSELTLNTRTVFPPLIVISEAIVLVPVPALISIVTGAGPQSNVTSPPPASAASRAASVQLSGVPVPTTAAARAVRGVPARSSPVAAQAAEARTQRDPEEHRLARMAP